MNIHTPFVSTFKELDIGPLYELSYSDVFSGRYTNRRSRRGGSTNPARFFLLTFTACQAAKNNWEVVSAARQARKNRRESGKWWWTAGIGGVRDSEEEEKEEEGEIRSREGAEGGGSSYGCWPRGEKTKTPFRRGGSTRTVVPASSSDLAVSEVKNSVGIGGGGGRTRITRGRRGGGGCTYPMHARSPSKYRKPSSYLYPAGSEHVGFSDQIFLSAAENRPHACI